MTNCDHEECLNEAVGTLIWDTTNQLERDYCSNHLVAAREELPDWVDSVQIV